MYLEQTFGNNNILVYLWTEVYEKYFYGSHLKIWLHNYTFIFFNSKIFKPVILSILIFLSQIFNPIYSIKYAQFTPMCHNFKTISLNPFSCLHLWTKGDIILKFRNERKLTNSNASPANSHRKNQHECSLIIN